jgi:hypothetical protein
MIRGLTRPPAAAETQAEVTGGWCKAEAAGNFATFTGYDQGRP